MSIILNIETSSKNCSVSISESGKIIGLEEQYFEKYSHSKFLHVYIDKLFKKTKLSPNDLSAVAISEGPGSYTGLRIGVSANNIINIFDYNSYDPEVSNFGAGGLSTGVEVTPFPSAKRIDFHVSHFCRSFIFKCTIHAAGV